MIILRNSEKLNRDELDALIIKIKALVYARVSSDGQVDNYSLETQIDRCVSDAKLKLNLDDDEIIVCVEEAESGDNPNRPMINYVLFLLEKGIGSKVIILHPNRLSRYLNLQQNITHKVWELGCDLHFVEFDLNRDNPESMLMYNVQGSIAQYNKSKILADTKRGRKAMVASGKIPGLNRVYGYDFDKDLDILVENETEKEAYLLMVDLIVNKNKSCSEVARTLSKKYNAPKGDKWYQTTVSRILRNPLFMGNYFYGKTEYLHSQGKKKIVKKPRSEWKAIPIPQYITENQYLILQEKLDSLTKNNSKSGRPSESYLLKGLARCGRCGAAVSSGITTRTNNGLIKYYSCTRKSKKSFVVGSGEHNEICKGRNWRVDKVDNVVWKEVEKLIKNPEQVINNLLLKNKEQDKIDEINFKIGKTKKELNEKKSEKERYIDLYASGFIKTKSDLEKKIGNLDELIEDLEKELFYNEELLKSTVISKGDIDACVLYLQRYENGIQNGILSMEEKKEAVNLLVSKVVLKEKKALVEFILNPFMRSETNSYSNQTEGNDDQTHKNIISSQGNGGSEKPVCTHSRRLSS